MCVCVAVQRGVGGKHGASWKAAGDATAAQPEQGGAGATATGEEEEEEVEDEGEKKRDEGRWAHGWVWDTKNQEKKGKWAVTGVE